MRWFRECEKYIYPIGSGVGIPVRPSGFWAEEGRLRLLWVQSWKGHTLGPLQKAVLHTILRETHFVGDFRTADLEWLDLRERYRGSGRSIEVISGDALGFVSRAELQELLGILLAAFHEYAATKAARQYAQKAEANSRPTAEGTPLFPEDPS